MAEKEEGMTKLGVECHCGEGTPPQDLTKVASGKAIVCGHCGTGWTGTGPSA